MLMDMSNERKEYSVSLESSFQYQFCFAVVVDYFGKTQNGRVRKLGRGRQSRNETNPFVPRHITPHDPARELKSIRGLENSYRPALGVS